MVVGNVLVGGVTQVALHPKIPVDNILKVAGVGTGTAIWLLDVQDQLPKQAQLNGFDISFDAAPPVELLPSGVPFHHWDVREDIPDGFAGTFDIVHVRFFSFVLLNHEIPGVVTKMFNLLKPGGFIQWEEADMKTLRFDKAKPESSTGSLAELFKLLTVQDHRLKPTWANHLPELLSQSGFIDVGKDVRDAPPDLA